MSADLLSYLVTSSSSEDIARMGAARDLVAARVIARKADQGDPDALAFAEGAQQVLGQAAIRRARANRLRAASARASFAGQHELARMGAEAASEEEREASRLEGNVVAAVRNTHAPDGFGYYSESERRELQRKSFEEGLSASQREDLMNKLTAQLYSSSGTLNGEDAMGADDAASAMSFLDAASELYGGDLDSVFGADAAERMGAVLGAAVAQTEARIDEVRGQLDMAERASTRKHLKQRLAALRDVRSLLVEGARPIAEAEDLRVETDAAEDATLDQYVDFGAGGRVVAMVEKMKTMNEKQLQRIARDIFRKKAVREAARAELARREEGGSEEADASEEFGAAGKRVAKMREKLKGLSDARVRAIAKDPFRKKAVREAARAELARRARSKEEGEDDTDETESGDEMVATPPKAFDEEGYLASYKGVTPGRRALVGYFHGRAARMGADDPAVLAYAVQSEESFGGFFQSLGEFFRNLFAVGARDSKRISQASRAAREARQSKRSELKLKEDALALAEARMARFNLAFQKEKDPARRAELQAKIDALRPVVRQKRQEVRAAGKAAFEQSMQASTPGTPAAVAPSFPVTGDPILMVTRPYMKDTSKGGSVPNDQISVLQNALIGLGYTLGLDGTYGPKTEAAVKSFQKKNALKVDGKVGPATAAVLATAVRSLTAEK